MAAAFQICTGSWTLVLYKIFQRYNLAFILSAQLQKKTPIIKVKLPNTCIIRLSNLSFSTVLQLRCHQRMHAECWGDICQWSSNLYQCFVHRQMIVPEGLWEIMGQGKQRDPAADSLTHSTGIQRPAAVFSAIYSKPHDNTLNCHIFHGTKNTP